MNLFLKNILKNRTKWVFLNSEIYPKKVADSSRRSSVKFRKMERKKQKAFSPFSHSCSNVWKCCEIITLEKNTFSPHQKERGTVARNSLA